MFMEWCSGGNVRDYAAEIEDPKLREEEVRRLFRQIVSAVEHCHNHNIAHRDLKALNLMLDCRKNVKLLDFGLSVQCWPGQKVDNEWPGSPPYAAPELFRRESYLPMAADVWSLGVVLYELVYKRKPFEGKTHKELMEKVLQGSYALPGGVNPDLKKLIRKMLQQEPEKRLRPHQIKADAWLSQSRPNVMTASTNPDEIIEEMKKMGIDRETVLSSLQKHSFGRISGIYNIISNRYPTVESPRLASGDVHGLPMRWQKKLTMQKDQPLDSIPPPPELYFDDEDEAAYTDGSVEELQE
eukprot:Colp12_sorted_trinity150504_noHs@34509